MNSSSLLLLSLLVGQPQDTPTEFIDAHFRKHWQAEKITPSAQAPDHAFLRRASLDLIGRIPTNAEREGFFKAPPKSRRRDLIDRLLAHDDYARHWGNVWSDWLLGTRDEPNAKIELHDWLQRHFAMGDSHKNLALRLLTATGNTRDNPAVHWFVAQRGLPIPEKKWAEEGQYDMVPLTGLATRLFLGKHMQCVQCHDHPFTDQMIQREFWGLNGLFRQVAFRDKLVNKQKVIEIHDDPKLNERGILGLERRNGVIQFAGPRFFSGPKYDAKLKQTRREFFADQVVKSPDFAAAHVHRMWGYLFHLGLNGSADGDDLGDHSPTSSHAAVVERLAKEFVKSDHDPKTLFRIICASDVYGLSSVANKTNSGWDKAVHFGLHRLQPLAPEQLVESLIVVLRPKLEREERQSLSRTWLKEFQSMPRQQPSHCEAEKLGPPEGLTSDQMFWLMNSKTIHRALSEDNVVVTAALRHKTVAAGVDHLFLEALGRSPSAKERLILADSRSARLAKKVDLKREEVRCAYYEDILWSLLNSTEFATNH